MFILKNTGSISKSLVVALIAAGLSMTSGAEPAQAAGNPASLNFDDTVCQLGTAGYAGDGSESAPYEITDPDALWELAVCSTGAKHFKIMSDLNVANAQYAPTNSPIGASTSLQAFQGVVNGNGKRIYGISMSSSTNAVGLFNSLISAEIRNLTIEGSFISNSASESAALALTAQGYTTISNLIARVTVSGTTGNTGGLISRAVDGGSILQISQVNVFGAISSSGSVGGFIARSSYGEVAIAGSSNYAAVSGSSLAAGFVGNSLNSTISISNSSNFGAVSGNSYVAGFIGSGANKSEISIDASANHGQITGGSANSRIAGLVGRASSITISNSSNQATINGNLQTGGLVGEVEERLAVTNATNNGEVFGGDSVGGLVGSIATSSTELRIQGGLNLKQIKGTRYVGGLVGWSQGELTIDQSTNVGEIVSGHFGHTDIGIGGFVGSASALIVSSGTNAGSVTAERQRVGGIVGNASKNLTISGTTNHAQVISTGGERVGGLAGFAEVANISASENRGQVSSSHRVGGLIGAATNLVATQVTNSATISGLSHVGGIAGGVSQDALIEHTRNVGKVFGEPTSASGDNYYVGGFVGFAGGAKISSSTNNGDVYSNDYYLGGFVGAVGGRPSILTNVVNSGSVRALESAAGLVGYSQNSSAYLTVSASVNYGPVEARRNTAGLVGVFRAPVEIYESANFGSVTSWLDNDVAGILDGRYSEALQVIQNVVNFGEVFAKGGMSGGIISQVHRTAGSGMLNSLNVGPVQSDGTPIDGLVASHVPSFLMTNNYSLAASGFSPAVTKDDLQKSQTYVGWDFDNVWGFGACDEYSGYPTPRALGLVETYYSDACYAPAAPAAQQVAAPAPVYSGPILSSGEAHAGSPLKLTGSRLESINKVFAGDVELSISAVSNSRLELLLPDNIEAGFYDLVVASGFGTLTIQRGLRVLAKSLVASESSTSTSESNLVSKEITVGSFKGLVAIYTKGYEGQRLSARIAGKWHVVPKLDESRKGTSHSRTTRKTQPGRTIKVHLYIDRKFVKVEEILTR